MLTGINNNGIAVGYYMDGELVQHAFIFNSNTNTFTYIPDQSAYSFNPHATDTVATAINDEGIVVGYYGLAPGQMIRSSRSIPFRVLSTTPIPINS